MKCRRPSRHAQKHSVAAFALAVALAFVASVAQLLPDITAQSADAMPGLPDGLDLVMADFGMQ